MAHVVILGAGLGGVIMAYELRTLRSKFAQAPRNPRKDEPLGLRNSPRDTPLHDRFHVWRLARTYP